jgi:hypothetical protein
LTALRVLSKLRDGEAMSDPSGSDEQREPPPDAPLPYRNPLDDEPKSAKAELVMSAIATAIIWFAAVAGLIANAFAMDYRGPFGPQGQMGSYIALISVLTLFAGTVLLALRWQRRTDRRHRAIGIWIGFALACMIEGLCFFGDR